jgi:hypothetical protein
MFTRSIIAAAVVTTLGAFGATAHAIPISADSSIGFSGQATPNPAATQWGSATGITFGSVIATGGTGTFSGVSFGTLASFTNFTFSPFAPVTSVWSVTAGGNTFTFDLMSVSSVTQNVINASNSNIELFGSGLFRSGQDSAAGSFNFTGNQSGGTFNFSLTDNNVPLPGTLALLGLGLLGAGALRRKAA